MKIDIAAISLDIQNFRHEQATTEHEALRFLLTNEKLHKVSELAADIVQQGGLDPSSLLIVTTAPNSSDRFIALEGNRRITALKALMTPDLAAGTPGYSQFKALHASFLKLNINAVECVVLDRAQAAIWIRRKHYKGMGGKGTVAWNAVGRARSDAADGRFTRWLTALAYLERHDIDAEEISDKISTKTTTVERVLTSPYILSVLGLNFGKDGNLTPENGDEAAAAKLVQALMEAMTEKSFIEPIVSTSEQQLVFINKFASLSVKKVEATSGTNEGAGATEAAGTTGSSSTGGSSGKPEASGAGDGSHSSGGSAAAGSSGTTGSGGSTTTAAAASNPGATVRSKPVKTRKSLAAPGLKISNAGLNKFYSELRKLNVEKNPYVSAAMIRVFLEKSSTAFLEYTKIPPLNNKPGSTWNDTDIKLRIKVDAVLKNMDSSGADPRFTAARDVANGVRDKIHTADQLNFDIHSHHSIPSPTEIITIWDRFHPYFTEMFKIIENQGKK